MQATSTKRFVRSRAGGMVAAFGVFLIGVVAIMVVALNSTGSQGETSAALPVTVSDVIQFDRIQFLEENTAWQAPYTAPPTLSFQEMTFVEDNTIFQTPYSMPALSYEEIRLWEENTWGYDSDNADSR